MESSVSARIAQYLSETIRSGEHERIGPFVAGFSQHSDNPWRNYAVPDIGAQPSAGDVAALVAAFRDRSRRPRLEYVPLASPEVEPALLAAGFTVEGRPPLMTVDPGRLVRPATPDGFVVTPVDRDDDLLDVARVQHEAYGEPEPPGEPDVARLRSTIARGGVVVLARHRESGAPAGAGLSTGPQAGIGELAAVAVAQPYRQRGLASAVTAKLAATALAGGADLVWLEPEGPRAQRLYERLGFASGGEKLWISLA